MLMVINWYFTAFFILELLIQLLVNGPWEYYSTAWGWFDTFIVLVSMFTIAIEMPAIGNAIGLTDLGFNPTFLRILRCARVLRLLKMTKTMLG
jgi:hypothetical protein